MADTDQGGGPANSGTTQASDSTRSAGENSTKLIPDGYSQPRRGVVGPEGRRPSGSGCLSEDR